ncbi:hypothetical protein T09_4712, partial [Trichinella sp. T9]
MHGMLLFGVAFRMISERPETTNETWRCWWDESQRGAVCPRLEPRW